MISHDHFDHLDVASVKALHQRFGSTVQWLVPLGLAAWLRSRGVERVQELDWWDSVTVQSADKERQVCCCALCLHAVCLLAPRAGCVRAQSV